MGAGKNAAAATNGGISRAGETFFFFFKRENRFRIYVQASMGTEKTKGAWRALRQIERTTVPAGQAVKTENTRGRRGRLTNGISTTEGHSDNIVFSNAWPGLDNASAIASYTELRKVPMNRRTHLLVVENE